MTHKRSRSLVTLEAKLIRCRACERLVEWLRAHHPEALPRQRLELQEPSTRPVADAGEPQGLFTGDAEAESRREDLLHAGEAVDAGR